VFIHRTTGSEDWDWDWNYTTGMRLYRTGNETIVPGIGLWISPEVLQATALLCVLGRLSAQHPQPNMAACMKVWE